MIRIGGLAYCQNRRNCQNCQNYWLTISAMVTTSAELASYAEIVRQPLSPQQCDLLVIDIQEKLLPPIHEKERLVRNTQLLIRLSKILSLPVLATTQSSKGQRPLVEETCSQQ